MLGQRSARWQTCGSTSRVAGGAQQRSVVLRAFKRTKGGNRPGFADPPSNPGYNLPPLQNTPGYGSPPPQQQVPPPQQQQAQRPQQGGQQQQQQRQQQQHQQQRMPSPPPPQQPGWGPGPAAQPAGQPPATQPGFVNQPAAQPGFQPAQPGFNTQPGQPGFNNNQQPGFVSNPAAAPATQQPPAQSPAPPGYQQQPGFVQQNPAQGYPQQGGYMNPQQGGYMNNGGWQQQQPPQQQQGYPQQQQQPGFQQPPAQRGWAADVGGFVDSDLGGYIDQNGRVNPNDAGGYINPPQRSGWNQQGGNQGYYRNNNRQQQQQQQQNKGGYLDGGYMNDQGGWNQQRNRPGFGGFDSSPGDWTEDFLLRQLDGMQSPRMIEDWVEEQEVVEDLTPKYVNGRRVLVNSEITASQVRVQDAIKEDLGVMPFDQARETAYSQDVDVVMITEDANPPVVRLIAFSKYKYELEKTAKQKQKASKGPEIKEVKLRPVTEKADYDTKVKQAQKFLSKGAKVKLTMTFSGREMRFKDQGKEMMLKLIEELSTTSKMEAPLALRPSNFSVTLVPLK